MTDNAYVHSSHVKLSNPGSYDKVDLEIQRLLLVDSFEGTRLELQQLLGPALVLGNLQHKGIPSVPLEKNLVYSGSATLVNGDDMLITTVDHLKNGKVHWLQNYTGSLAPWSHRILAQWNPADKIPLISGTVERKGEDNTISVKAGLDNCGLDFLLALTPNLDVGAETTYSPITNNALVTAKARYRENGNTATCSSSSLGTLTASFLVRLDPKINVASEVEVQPLNSFAPKFGIGGEVVMNQAKFNIAATSLGIVQATVQDIVAPGVTLKWSAILDVLNEQQRYGVGVQIG